jgi:hypothetical protein
MDTIIIDEEGPLQKCQLCHLTCYFPNSRRHLNSNPCRDGIIRHERRLQQQQSKIAERAVATTTIATTATTQNTNNTTNSNDTENNDNDEDDIPEDIEIITPTHPLRQDDVYLINIIAKDIFVTSWTTEKKKLDNKATEIKMTKYVKLALLTKATDDAAAIVANEPTADMPQLSEIINKEVAKQTGQVQKELQKAVQQIKRLQPSTKNFNRGETSTRANGKKTQTRRNNNNTKSPAKSPQTKNKNNSLRNNNKKIRHANQHSVRIHR